jgi:MFS family permease
MNLAVVLPVDLPSSSYGDPWLLALTLVINVIGALIGAELARRRGRSPFLWGTLCFWFGFFALILLLILPRKQAESGPVPPSS